MNRRLLTEKLILDLDLDSKYKKDEAMALWWWDARPQGGLRLTDLGFEVFSNQAKLPHWNFDMPNEVLIPKNLLTLDRFMSCAYFIRRRGRQHQLSLFGNQQSVMASLYGDLNSFISSLHT